MILPEKHLGLTESYFGFGGFLLNLLDEPMTIDNLWIEFSKYNNTQQFNSNHTFDDFILAINYLFIIGALNQNKEGEIFREINKTFSE